MTGLEDVRSVGAIVIGYIGSVVILQLDQIRHEHCRMNVELVQQISFLKAQKKFQRHLHKETMLRRLTIRKQ